MTGLDPFGDPADRPDGPTRHRRASGLGARLATLIPGGRGPTGVEWIIGAAALALVAILGLGWVAINFQKKDEPGVNLPPVAAPPDAAPPDAAPSPSATPNPEPDPSPDNDNGNGNDNDNDNDNDNGNGNGNGNGNDDDDDDDGNEESAPLPEPRLVGPADAAGWETFLTTFCRERGDSRAALVPGRDGDSDGQWVCVEVTTFEPINLDDPCRREFGAASQARRTVRGDARTWRCFDR